MIKIFVFPNSKKSPVPNIGPFCVKLECYLKFTNTPYEKVFFTRLPRFGAPKGKLPFAIYNDQKIADSHFIIKALKKNGIDLDSFLNFEQKADCYAYLKMLDEHVAFILSYYRWESKRYFKDLSKIYFGKSVLAKPLAHYARNEAKKYYYAQGIGRHSEEEIDELFYESMQALSRKLGNKEYFFEKPSSLDASAYGFLVNMLDFKVTKHLTEIVSEFQNLVDFTDRITNNYFRENKRAA